MISIVTGLKNSLMVLEELRGNDDLNNLSVYVGTFTNCREQGLTFAISENGKCFTWCVYEHRNSDRIIINGKDGLVSMNGDLPYMADSKSVCLASFEYGEYKNTADKLAEMIIEKANHFNADKGK